ncbi:4781_t:CDS:1 [Paraglomus occultum]|uniref:4781_t:CDS:1 n=1 Tax=Paraglomus occultum TaxID=144539 RepID=A0A9N9CMG5_9GLOM|nr:4781_t:CDS:1 [Paraglomus occultum]
MGDKESYERGVQMLKNALTQVIHGEEMNTIRDFLKKLQDHGDKFE